MNSVLAWLRFILIIGCMAILVLAVLLIFPFSNYAVTQYVRILWTRCLIASTGAKLNIYGYKLNKAELANSMIVSNHISWLDTVIMLRLCFVQYIGKKEMLNWPILKSIIKAGGTIFIDRNRKRDLISVNQEVAALLKSGATIGLYPEGKTTPGFNVLPFKPGILQAGIMAQSKIFPIALSYRKENNLPAPEVSFANVNWLTTVLNTLRLNNLIINVTVLPPVKCADFVNREKLAEYLHNVIQRHYMDQQQTKSALETQPIIQNEAAA